MRTCRTQLWCHAPGGKRRWFGIGSLVVPLSLCFGYANAHAGPTTRPDAPESQSVELMSVKSPASSVVFILDAEEFMVRSVGPRIEEAVTHLNEKQEFDVIVFRRTGVTELAPNLLPANAENAKKLHEFFANITPTVVTNPLPAIDAAFALSPTVIYLVADGDFPDNNTVLARTRQDAKGNNANLNAIAIHDKENDGTGYMRMLKTASDVTGGKYAELDGDSLRLPR